MSSCNNNSVVSLTQYRPFFLAADLSIDFTDITGVIPTEVSKLTDMGT